MTSPDLQRRLNDARQLLLGQKFTQAFQQYQKLLRQAPGQAAIWYEYGNAALGLRDAKTADFAWDKALELEPGNAELIGLIGHQFQGMRRPERARACFERAAAADPRGINPRISLAVLHEQNHRLEDARRAVEQCLAIDPGDDQARYFTAVLDRRENQLEKAEHGLRNLIASPPKHPFVRYASRYELAQILDRTERFDEAMQLLAEAKEIVRGLTNTELLLKGYDQTAESARRFTRNLPVTILQSWAGVYPPEKREPKTRLAFLGGHPRSGTTLLEQVLDAHPEIAAADESPAFLQVLQPEFHRSKELSSSRLNSLRRLYLEALQQGMPAFGGERLLVDKNPSPTARLPLWLRVFPELRVLIALRDPRDVVLSCYFQNIPLNATNVNFLSLERIARHYADLMDIWLLVREWPCFAWLETRYEDLVAGLETEARKVTEFLGLAWHPEQARFYEKSRQKQLYSPTYQDVTRPV
ncbi:MAG TPA: sulfotransferase, partial [Verrucomicrobiae bacterium]|nr:sulfotransferase [Verrucomicrobiae bacterium]